jgi:hypothetical protein
MIIPGSLALSLIDRSQRLRRVKVAKLDQKRKTCKSTGIPLVLGTNCGNTCNSAVFSITQREFDDISARIHAEMQEFGADYEKEKQKPADLQFFPEIALQRFPHIRIIAQNPLTVPK